MCELVEGTYATGEGVVRPGRDYTPESSDSASDNDTGLGDDLSIEPALRQNGTLPILPSASNSSEVDISVVVAPFTQIPKIEASRKREAADSDETPFFKRQRGHGRKQSSGQAITGMASSIAQLASAVAGETAVPSPQRKRSAIHAIEDDGDLSEDEQIQVFKIIRRDTAFADTLLAIRKKESRTRFIKSELYDE